MGATQDNAWHAFLHAQTRRNNAANKVAQLVSAGYRGGPTLNEAITDYDAARIDADHLIEDWTRLTELTRLAAIEAAGGLKAWWTDRHNGNLNPAEYGADTDDDLSPLMEVPC